MPKIIKKYIPLYTSKKRYFILLGGRGSGKTFVVQDFLVRLLEQVGQGILYTRYTMTSAEKTIIPLFVDYIKRVSSVDNYEITRDTIIHKQTKAFIYFSGIKSSSKDQTGRLKSLPNITTWVVEEGEDFNNEKSFTDIDDSIRSKHLQNRVIWIQNPTTKNHFIWKKFFEGQYEEKEIEKAGSWIDANGIERKFTYQQCINPNVCHIQSSYYDNIENLDIEKVQQWEREKVKNPEFWQNNYGGAWKSKAEGIIFENWEEGEFDESLPFIFGQDYGSSSPTTLVKVAFDKKKGIVYLDECFYKTRLNTQQIFELNSFYAQKKTIIGDCAAKETIFALRTKGLNVTGVSPKPNVLASVQKLQSYKIVITPTSHNLKMELNEYIWSDKELKDVPVDAFNHLLDAVRYAMTYLDR
jgi:phage terminase large subunit